MPTINEDKTEIKTADCNDIIKEIGKKPDIINLPYGMVIKPAGRWFKFKLWLIKKIMPWKVKNL